MAISGTNNWGSFTANDGTTEYPNYPAPTGTSTPPATGTLTVAQSPSGSVTNQSNTYSYNNTITDTENVLKNVLFVESAQQGSAAQTAPVSIQGCSSVQQATWTSSQVTK